MFIELDRTFRKLLSDATAVTSDDSALLSSATSLRWPDLLQLHRVVILSEAGSGKTEEIRHAAGRLLRDGKPAWFLRLEHVASSFENAFEVGNYEEFDSWLSSTQEGWLFLDSVDEARLRDPGDFALAIRSLGRRLRSATQRLHVIVTGRTAAWRPLTDLDLCATHLPYTGPAQSARAPDDSIDTSATLQSSASNEPQTGRAAYTVVALEDLSVDQVRRFAAALQVSDVEVFLDDVERADGGSFTTRPLDLSELLEFWQANKRIGSRLELLLASIEKRLREIDPTRDEQNPLTPDRARRAARLLAAACTLTQQQTIAVPDSTGSVRGLKLDKLLHDWSAKERATLLQRPIFDEEIYGTVRFHHRSVREYLTAEWLAELLAQHTSRNAIEALIFREQYGLQVVSPVLRTVLPWLAILDPAIQERALALAPELLLGDGDPSSLLLTTRQRVLDATCASLAAGSPRAQTDYAAIQRFAAADLTQDVQRLLATYRDEESQAFLLRMVWQGRLSGARPLAMEAAMTPAAPTYVRKVAYRAVAATGADDDLESIRESLAREPGPLNREVVAEFLEAAPKSEATLAWLYDCLDKVADTHPYSVDHLREGLCALVAQLSIADLGTAITRFSHYLQQPPVYEKGDCDISTRYAWLLKPAALAVGRLIDGQEPAALGAASLTLLRLLPTAKEYDLVDVDGNALDLAPKIQRWPELKFALFWHAVAATRRRLEKKGERLTDWWRTRLWPSYVAFQPDDFGQALDCVASRSLPDDKLVAMSLAFRCYVELGRSPALRRRLHAACKGSPPLAEKLETLLHPPRQTPETIQLRRMNADWKRRSRVHAERQAKNLQEWRDHLQANVEMLRVSGLARGEVSQTQAYVHQRMRSSDKNSNTWTNADWRSLEPDFGADVARAFRDGAVAHWRHYRPALVSEGAALNTTPFAVIFGLTGIAIESQETIDWPAQLNSEEVELAFRYAMHELNGFPAWFRKVFEKDPAAVRDLLMTEIDHELRIGAADQDTHYVIYDINWYGEWLWESLSPGLLERLTRSEPANLRNLRQLLNVLQASGTTDEALRNLAASKASSSERPEHRAQWYAVWIGVEPAVAIPALASHADSLATPAERSTFVMTVLTQLVDGRRNDPSRVRRAYCTAPHLKSLYLLAHRHVRAEEDIQRANSGVYSPGLRDHAQDARDHLLSLLRTLPGKETFVALSEIAREHPSADHRPYVAHYAKAVAEADSAGPPWSEEQVRDFSQQHERTPANHRQLFDLACLRLADLKDELEHGDSSNAPMLAKVGTEDLIRIYIGNWLRDCARGRYAVPQEEQLADRKRPDLRFHGKSFDAPIPLELKLAEKWTGPDLFERLEVQLCGDYLRDARSTCGIFLLFYRGAQQRWQLPGDAGSVDFDGLVLALRRHWEALSPRLPNVQDVLVIGIDLTKRTIAASPP
jgi:hypothetical protein